MGWVENKLPGYVKYGVVQVKIYLEMTKEQASPHAALFFTFLAALVEAIGADSS